MATHALETVKERGIGGRPTLYRYEYCDQAFRLALLGATDLEMADFFGVAESTIYEWKQAQPEFSESIKRGKPEADANVAHSLYHKATKLGDTTAMIFWLKNRKADQWRDRSNVDFTSNGQSIAELAAAAYARAEIKRQERDRIADIPAPLQIEG